MMGDESVEAKMQWQGELGQSGELYFLMVVRRFLDV